MALYIRPYNRYSASVQALRDKLGRHNLKFLLPQNEDVLLLGEDLIINWGCTVPMPVNQVCADVLNYPNAVQSVSNKVNFFNSMQQAEVHCVVPATMKLGEALNWLDDGYTVVIRNNIASHSGKGIRLFTPDDWTDGPLPNAPLYTKYIKKHAEYRVHMFRHVVFDDDDEPTDDTEDEIVFIQEKRRRKDVEVVNWQVRTHNNGFIFANQNVDCPFVVQLAARQVFEALSLEFAAIDVLYQERSDKAFVVEVNSAPGLVGKTLDIYAEQFKRYFR